MPKALEFGPPIVSVDVEDWPQSTWNRELPITARAADNTRYLLDLLEKLGVRATMFVLGKFAAAFPEVVCDIRDRGHEVACHGYGHVEVFKQSPREFRNDVRRAKQLLEQIAGVEVIGYRAPDFSITTKSLWALTVLAEEGFQYDSSIYPVKRPRYGIANWPSFPTRVECQANDTLIEFPIARYSAFGKHWPVGGGGYHRLLPGWAFRFFARRVMKSSQFVFYCHPYEFDPREFAEIGLQIPLLIRLHQGLGRSSFERRFVAFLRRFGGRRFVDIVDEQCWPESPLSRFAASSGAVGSCPVAADEATVVVEPKVV